jgi:hypothetical protein
MNKIDNTVFISKYDKLEAKIADCIPEGSEIMKLDSHCALITLPRVQKRKAFLQRCRERLEEKERGLLQSVISCKESADSIEVALPDMKRFFPKTAVL